MWNGKHKFSFWWGQRKCIELELLKCNKSFSKIVLSVTVSTLGLRNTVFIPRLEMWKVMCNFSIFHWNLGCTSHCTWVRRHAKLILVARRTNSSCVKSLKLRLINLHWVPSNSNLNMIGLIFLCVGPVTLHVTYCIYLVWKCAVFLSGLPSTFCFLPVQSHVSWVFKCFI